MELLVDKKIEIFGKNRNSGEKSNFSLKIQFLVKNQNYGTKVQILAKNQNPGQKSIFWAEIKILDKNPIFGKNRNYGKKFAIF